MNIFKFLPILFKTPLIFKKVFGQTLVFNKMDFVIFL